MKDKTVQPTFLFHDYETFGKSPSLDRPAQFAGIRTDMDFTPVGDPALFYCCLADDYLPQPEAVMITGITPQQACARGVSEAAFAGRIHALFCEPHTCVVGYNNVRFDDEVTRHLFYRNFYDPYGWSWQNGNSRWDLLDVLRACYALRPEGINWPENETGRVSFRLEDLTRANHIIHEQAHDALSDVHATIAMAKLVREKQPRLFNYLFHYRFKQKLTTLIDIPAMTPLVHVSGMFGTARANLSLIAPLAWHPDNKNALITCDLAGDIAPLLTLNADELRSRLYTPHEALNGATPVPLKLVHINKCPVLAPLNTLRPTDIKRLQFDRQHCLNNLAILQQHPQIRDKVVDLFAQAEPFAASEDVDAQLYNGFFSEADKAAMNIIRQTQPENLPALALSFNDSRLDPLLFRYRARNYPGTLNDAEQQRWLAHRRQQLNPQRVETFMQQLDALFIEHQHNAGKAALLKALFSYARDLLS